jgi:hypothetical protein
MKHLDDPTLASETNSGLTDDDRRIMMRLLRMPPEQQKSSPKPINSRAEAQRNRRKRERQPVNEASTASQSLTLNSSGTSHPPDQEHC